MWSVGCIFAEILTKNPLFNCNSTVNHFEKMLQIVGRPTTDDLTEVGEIASCLLKQCGQVRQKSAKELFGSVDEISLDLLYKLLKFDPRKRPSAG
jgi:serine/threonine protein kinase